MCRAFGSPVPALAGSLLRPGERQADHDGVGAARNRLRDVAAGAHRAVGDDVHVAPTRLVHVVATRGSASETTVAIGTPMPSTCRVVCAAPPPTPTSTPAAPVRIRCKAAW